MPEEEVPRTPKGDILFSQFWVLYSIKLDGSGPVPLLEGKQVCEAVLSPDGNTLVYCDGPMTAAVALPLAAGNDPVTLLTPVIQFVQHDPRAAVALRPDGQAVAVASSSFNGSVGSPLYIVNADGSGLSQVPGIDTAMDPAWRPN